MLKIREDVDLKELEKFGFEYIKNCDYPHLSSEEYRYSYLNTIFIYKNTRAIIVHYTDTDTLNKLYDLIQTRISNKGVRVWKK